MNKIKFILVGFCISANISAQVKIVNNTFGIEFSIPENWRINDSSEFSEVSTECIYSLVPKDAIVGERFVAPIITVKAKANGYTQSLQDVMLFQKQRLYRDYKDLVIVSESDSSLRVSVKKNGIISDIIFVYYYQNEIGYIVSFQSVDSFIESGKIILKELSKKMKFVTPIVQFNDLDKRIKENPEDATLYLQKAQREFDFHKYNNSLSSCDSAIEIFPLGEAYYLRGYVNLAMGDTLAACKDFYSSSRHDYECEFEIIDFCNTKKMAEAIEGEQESQFLNFDENANHYAYIDSVKQHEYMIMSIHGEPSAKDYIYINQLNHLYMLDYKQLDSLLIFETGIIQMYALGIISTKYSDKLTNEHKKSVNSVEKIQVLTSSAKDPISMTMKEISKRIMGGVELQKDEIEIQKRSEKAVDKFILKYAKYPDSYQSISYQDFHVMSIVDGSTGKRQKNSENPVIGHSYKLMNANGEIMEYYNTFKLTYDFKMNIIEGEESNTVSSYPPDINKWIELNGRSLSKKDKKKLGLQD
jgi:tetratricopeptide (TPR) repeat protein